MKICFIIPYFGKFNNYFQLFLDSCRNNPSVNWLIITDDKTDYQYPDNVKVIYSTFGNLVHKIQDEYDFEISLDVTYKLCDY